MTKMTDVNLRVAIKLDGSDYDLSDLIVKVPMDLTIEDPEGVMPEYAAGMIVEAIRAKFAIDWPVLTDLYEEANKARAARAKYLEGDLK